MALDQQVGEAVVSHDLDMADKEGLGGGVGRRLWLWEWMGWEELIDTLAIT